MLLAQNLTKTSYFWNSTGWLAGSYLARVRAYSVDCSSPECSLDNPPLSYWPGDFSDAITPQFQAGDVPHSIPPNSFTIDASISANDSYQFGSTNNVISVHVVVNGTHDFLPEHIYYSITDNGSFWFDGELAVITYDDFYTINVDGLSIGEHNLSIRIRDWWSTKYFDVTLVVIGPN